MTNTVKKYSMGGGMSTTYILSFILICGATIYLAVFSGMCQKLTVGCVPIDSTTSQLGIAGIGITIGLIIAIAFTLIKPMLCTWPRGVGTIILMVIIAGILITCSAITMKIYNEPKFDDNDKPIDQNAKLVSMLMNSVLFLSMGIGIIYAVLMNLMSLNIGRKPITILGITVIPIALYSIVAGIIVLTTYNKTKNSAGICDKYPIDKDTNLSGIANIVGNNGNPPAGTVLGMTIGSGIFLVLIGITLYFTKGKM